MTRPKNGLVQVSYSVHLENEDRYARVSTAKQDVTAQREALVALGVDERHIYLDEGLTGMNRECPGLEKALASVRPAVGWRNRSGMPRTSPTNWPSRR